ncbi:hypothetical protein [Streptomyces sp. or20]|uniref:hypothetical protein n=1 Tax=Streptomyces sp. or20 TaxID=1828016 RepID=UPI0015CF0AF2|nr:hypothetical protein [Streptomyces sp. or20]
MVGDVGGQYFQLGVEGLADGHLQQPARRRRDEVAAEREPVFPGAPTALHSALAGEAFG